MPRGFRRSFKKTPSGCLQRSPPAGPPAPVPTGVVRVRGSGAAPRGDGPASPGVLDMTVSVPSIGERAVGSNPLKSVVLTLGAESQTIPIAAAVADSIAAALQL